MATKFSPGEWVVIKSAEEIRELKGDILCGWVDDMYSLCGKLFRITEVCDFKHGQILNGHYIGCWNISSDMVKLVDNPADTLIKPLQYDSVRTSVPTATVPCFATAAGPAYSTSCGDVKTATRMDGDMARYDIPAPYSEKKKSRIQFSKIR